MPPLARQQRLLLALALLLAAATLAYSILWMAAVRWQQQSLIGFDGFTFRVTENALELEAISEGGPAERAGLLPGDRILAVDGHPFTAWEVLHDRISNRAPGTIVHLTIQRPGQAQPGEYAVTLEPWPTEERSSAQRIANELIDAFPLPFLLVGFAVLFLRRNDRHAWILALLFTSIVASAPLLEFVGGVPPWARGFALAFRHAFGSVGGSLFYMFLAVFPVRSPLDRRLPWLKWTLLALQGTLGLIVAVPLLLTGESRSLFLFGHFLDSQLPWIGPTFTALAFGSFLLGIVSLVLNTVRAPTTEVRRRTRVIVWGLALGPLPFLLVQVVALIKGVGFTHFPYWVWAPSVIFVLLMPLATAYAVLKHRVLEIPVLLRRSARYFLVQRGFLVLITAAGVVIVVVAATQLSHALRATAGPAEAPHVTVALAAALSGILVVWLLSRVHARVASRIDRAFFRSAYDARLILEDLIDRSRRARDRDELCALLREYLSEALQPTSLAVYLRTGEQLVLCVDQGGASQAGAPATLAADDPLVTALARHARPWDTADGSVTELAAAATAAREAMDCLVPILDRDGRILGLLALGPRRSEEPYSGEDLRLLAGIAGQVGLTLESVVMAEDIARRIEADRRVAREMEIARQVQVNLLPSQAPTTATLELAAHCVQARAVGGDFYDYLPLGDGHLGLVLADISGKGMSAALLMSSLLATLRSHAGELAQDPVRVLQDINLRLLESTRPDQFATVFFGDHDDATGRLRYVNCGHNPPLILRRDGRLEELEATATVLGAFPVWPCEAAVTTLAAGDLLVVYSDGVTEAGAEGGELFGEERLGAVVREHRDAPLPDVLQAILAAVAEHGGGAEDDLTLLLGRVREA